MTCGNEEHQGEEGCCHNKPSFHKLNQNQLFQETQFKSFEIPDASNDVILAVIEIHSFDKFSLRYFNYKPPLILYDRQVLLQTFLC